MSFVDSSHNKKLLTSGSKPLRCTNEDKEFIALGDMNLCSKQMNEPGYPYSSLSDIVNNFNIEEDCHQLVDDFTRIR